MLVQSVDFQTRKCNTRVMDMQKAAVAFSKEDLSPLATRLPSGRQVGYSIETEGHQALIRLIDREKDKIQGKTVVRLLHMSLSGPHPQSEKVEDRKH